jgi:putrescine aminotransferase
LITFEEAMNLTIDDVWDLYRKHVNPKQVELIGSFPFGRELVQSANGCWITLKSGRKILDLTGGIGVLNHGHNHPRILKVRNDFARLKLMEVHKNFFSPFIAALGSNLAELLPSNLTYSYFANSGAEAVEGAVKLAYKFHEGKRSFILHSNISFHGKLLGAAGLTGSPEIHFKFPTIPNTAAFKYDDFNSVQSLVRSLRNKDTKESDVYAIILEPLNASTMRQVSGDFLIKLRDLCDKENIVLIFDEVYTGWGKTGFLFNFMRVDGLVPDVLTYAKSFGGGKSSISGYSYTARIATAYQSLRDATLHSTTYYGFGEETVTAIEALNILKEDALVDKALALGIKFKDLLLDLPDNCSYLEEVRGSGALWGLIFKSPETDNFIRLIKALGGKLPIVQDLVSNDPRFASKLVAGSIVNSLYLDFGVLTYIGVNEENPLIVSFPLIAGEKEIVLAVTALRDTLSKPISTHLARFIKSKIKAP